MIFQHCTVANVARLGVRDMGAVVSVQHDSNLVVVDVALQGLRGPPSAIVDPIVEVTRGSLLLEVKGDVEVVMAVNGHVRFTTPVAIHNLGVAPRRASCHEFGMPQLVVAQNDVNDVNRSV